MTQEKAPHSEEEQDSKPKDLEKPYIPDADHMPPLIHSLSALLRLAGRGVSAQYLYAGLTGDSPSPAACLRAAKRAGLHGAIIAKPNLESISPLTLPCILLLNNDRSCILLTLDGTEPQKTDVEPQKTDEEETKKRVHVLFPEHGEKIITVNAEELESEYTGYALFASFDAPPDKRIEGLKELGTKKGFEHSPKQEKQQGASWFWSAMQHYVPIYRHAFMASIVINIVAVATPLFTMNVYDRVIPNNAMETLWVLASGIAIIYFFDFLLRSMRSYFVDLAGRNADVVISSLLLQKILTMRLDAKPASTGALVNNIGQFEALRDFFSSSTLLALIDVPFLCIFLLLLYFIGGPLVFLPLIAMPILFMAGYLFQWAARRSAEQHYAQGMQKNALLVEIVHGLETIKTNMAENRMQGLWEEVTELSAASTIDSRKYTNRALAFSTLISQSVTVGMIVWGVYRIEEGLLTMGGLIASNILAGRAMAPLMQMAGLLTRLQNARLSLHALNAIMALPTENSQASTSVTLDTSEGSFTIKDVSFAYPQAERLALHDINVHIGAGEKVGIIGGMGSGKSTLAKLLMGLYEPREGAVKFGGVDIRQMATAELRSRIGFVPQDALLFYGSIRDNIILGDAYISDQRIVRAADIAGVTDFVRHNPAGFGAQVGEQGKELSGGQRQAITLARAIVRNPHVLILDEPTSNMDTQSEKMVQKRLHALSQHKGQSEHGKTLILITHRMSMLRMVDRVIVMEAGRIIKDGPRERILKELQMQPSAKSSIQSSKKIPPSLHSPQKIEGGKA